VLAEDGDRVAAKSAVPSEGLSAPVVQLVGEQDFEKMAVFLRHKVLVFLRRQTHLDPDVAAALGRSVPVQRQQVQPVDVHFRFLQRVPLVHTGGRNVFEGNFDAAQEFVGDVSRGGVESFLDEFSESPGVLDLVDFAEFVAHFLLRIEVPNVDAKAVRIHTVHVQNEFLVPLWVESFGFVAGVVARLGIGGQVESAEGVAGTTHVLPYQITRLHNLQVDFQIGLFSHACNVEQLLVLFFFHEKCIS